MAIGCCISREVLWLLEHGADGAASASVGHVEIDNMNTRLYSSCHFSLAF